MRDYTKILEYIFITVILGAVGSGLWEICLKPLINNTSGLILKIMSSVLSTYSNRIYLDIAKGIDDRNVLDNYQMIIFLFSLCLVIFIEINFKSWYLKS